MGNMRGFFFFFFFFSILTNQMPFHTALRRKSNLPPKLVHYPQNIDSQLANGLSQDIWKKKRKKKN
jgi:hypothetical protein